MTVDQQQVLPAVVVEVDEAAAPSDISGIVRQTCRGGHLVELPRAAVTIKRLAFVREIRSKDVRSAVPVIVSGCNSHAGHCPSVLIVGNAAKDRLFVERT